MTAEQFKNVRKSTGLSQLQFAELLGYTSYRHIIRKEKENAKDGAAVTRQDEIILLLTFPSVLKELNINVDYQQRWGMFKKN